MNRTKGILVFLLWLIFQPGMRAQQASGPKSADIKPSRPAEAESCVKTTDTLFPIREHSKYGYIDQTGQIVIPPKFDYVENFREGMAVIAVGGKLMNIWDANLEASPWAPGDVDHFGGKYGYIDTTGKIVVRPQYDWAGDFSEGLAPVAVGGKWISHKHRSGQLGYIDKTGKMVIPARYSYAGGFCGGLAAVAVGGKWERDELVDEQYGYIDKNGQMAIPAQFRWAGNFFEGLAAVTRTAGESECIDQAGQIVNQPCGRFSDGLRRFVSGEHTSYLDRLTSRWVSTRKKGYIDRVGQIVIPVQYEGAGSFAEGLAPVMVGGQWGFIDKTGKAIIALQYDYAKEFSEGLAAVHVGTKWYVDAYSGGHWGYIDKTGQLIIPAEFDNGETFTRGLAEVVAGHKWGYIDKSGKYVWQATN